MSFYDPSLPINQAIERVVLHIVRQSTYTQKTENQGSGRYQLSVREFCREMGWPEERIKTLDARGESGSRGERATFHRILREVKTGRVGAVAFARKDRLGRTALESEELLKAAAKHRTLIITEGRVYNPASASDKLILSLMAQFAEYENNARTLWMMATRLTLAKEGAYRVVLPTGLIAGSPEDPKFVAALEAAGLGSHLEGLENHKAVSTRKGQKYYVLPYPDIQVYEACRMRMECMLATRDLDQVVEMICTDPDYPNPGLIPATKAVRRYHEGIEVRWIDVNHPNGRNVLRKWFRSPALYGTYQFSSQALAQKNPESDPNRFRVRIENAFPGFAPSEEEARIAAVISGNEAERTRMRGQYEGPRRHLLPELRCGRRDEHGEVCGRKMMAMYQPDGSYAYYSHACRFNGHPTQHVYGTAIDTVVQDRLLELFDPERLSTSMESLRIDEGSAKDRLRALQREVDSLAHKIKGVQDAVVQAGLDEAVDRRILFTKRLDELIADRHELERRLADAQADLANFKALAASDRAQILELGSDLEALLPMAREHNPKVLRALMRELVECVHFNRISGFACEIELRFPGGGIIKQELMTRRMKASRAALEYAAGRLAAGDSPGRIAESLNRARPKNHSVPWDEERVITAPVALRRQKIPDLRDGEYRSLTEVAREHGVDPEDVFIPAVHGDLGPGYYEDGEIHVCPTLEEAHRWIPGAARNFVVESTGWSPDLVIRRSEASKRSGLSRGAVMNRARKNGRLAKDATGCYWVCLSDVE